MSGLASPRATGLCVESRSRSSTRLYACAVSSEKWERNSIHEAVAEGGLDKIECSFDDHEVPWRLTHTPSGAYVLVGGRHGHHELTAVVGDGPPRKTDFYTWPSVNERIKGWAREVRLDVDTPDLWDEVRRRQAVLTGAIFENSDNSPFTAAEQGEIDKQVRQMKKLVRAQPISEARMRSAEAKLDFLVSAARHQGRKEWALMFVGAVVSVIVADLLPREVMGDTLSMASHVLGHLFGGAGGTPQFPPMTPLPPLV